MYTISKEFHFSASHQLLNLPDNHPCGRFHGHNYTVIVELKDNRLKDGFVLDYGLLDPIKEYIDNHLDHRHLNNILSVSPTAENIAEHLFRIFKPMFPQLSAVMIKETEKTCARYEEPIN